jgi:hypothetical protein
MTPDQFAAWLESRGVVEYSPPYSQREPQPKGPYFARKTGSFYDPKDLCVRFFVSAGAPAPELLRPHPIRWDPNRASNPWVWYDQDTAQGTDGHHRSDTPQDLLRLELDRQAAVAWRTIQMWQGMHTDVVGLAAELVE